MKPPESQSEQKPPTKEKGQNSPLDVSPFEGPLSETFQSEIDKLDSKDSELARKVANVVLGIVKQESFSGPLPHPRHLQAYNEILPGAADRIIAMAEKEQAHRHSWEDKSLKFDFSYSVLGIALGFLVALALLLLAYMSSQAGHQTVALAFLAASSVGMAASFIKGTSWLNGRTSDQPPKNPQPDAKPQPGTQE